MSAATQNGILASFEHLDDTATAEQRSVLRTTLDFWRDPFAFMDGLSDASGLVFTNFMGFPMVFISTPELTSELLLGPPDLWQKDRLMKRTAAVFGDGLLLSDGESWKRQRRMLSPGFRRARYAAYAEVMLEEADASLARWPNGERIDLAKEVAAATRPRPR